MGCPQACSRRQGRFHVSGWTGRLRAAFLPGLASCPLGRQGRQACVKSDTGSVGHYASCRREWVRPPWRRPRNRPGATSRCTVGHRRQGQAQMARQPRAAQVRPL